MALSENYRSRTQHLHEKPCREQQFFFLLFAAPAESLNMHFIPVLFSYILIRDQIPTHLGLTCCLNLQGSPPPPRMIVITRSSALVMSTWLSLSLMSPVNIRHTLMFKVCTPLTMTMIEIEVSILWTMDYGPHNIHI